MEGVLALVGVGMEWLVWLQIVGDLLLCLVIFHKNDTTEEDKTVFWDGLIEFQLFSCRRNCSQHRLACLTTLDVLGACQFLTKHAHDFADIVLWWDVE